MSGAFQAMRSALGAMFVLALSTGATHAYDGHGPDHWAVHGMEEGWLLPVHTGPGPDTPAIGTIKADADGLTNHRCVGEISFAEFSAATEAERHATRYRRWCLVGYRHQVGWVPGWHLAEGDKSRWSHPIRYEIPIASSWAVTRLDGQEPTERPKLSVRADGQVRGDTGCNKFDAEVSQTVTRTSDETTFTVGGITRRKCAGEVDRIEARFLAALDNTRRVLGTFHVMALLDEDDNVLAILRRMDWD